MPALENARHEVFAQGVAKGLSQDEAYARAGYKASRSAASRLSANVSVKARIAELVGKGAEKAEVSVAQVLQGLMVEATREGEGSSHGARVSAWSQIGKHLGMFVERVEHDVPAESPLSALLERIAEHGRKIHD
ncbi:terminase small subunit [Stappia indica]|uniref:terminase small subunit n=1 Tax=Stappia indica TaxID=538381 RepID=UPI001CD43C3F|nr:terminase small subunit [Stappia indica]MCA1298029.1 terminase small subunit [Stappia indica]